LDFKIPWTTIGPHAETITKKPVVIAEEQIVIARSVNNFLVLRAYVGTGEAGGAIYVVDLIAFAGTSFVIPSNNDAAIAIPNPLSTRITPSKAAFRLDLFDNGFENSALSLFL